MVSRRPRRAKPVPTVARWLTIEALGGDGDGLAFDGGRAIPIAGALPGERHLADVPASGSIRAPLVSLESADLQDRRLPSCPHFAPGSGCGGCAVQHLPDDVYTHWKLGRVERALHRQGLLADVRLLQRSPLGSRRRLRLAVAYSSGNARVGFRTRGGRQVVPVVSCSVARPELQALFSRLVDLLGGLQARVASVAITSFAAGLDLVLASDEPPALADRELIAAWAADTGAARLSWELTDSAGPETVVERCVPTVTWSPLQVSVPAGAFLQATEMAERMLQEWVTGELDGAELVVDLFAGLGTLSAPVLEAGRRLRAFEMEPRSVAALSAACGAIRGRAEIRQRDLDRQPVDPAELRRVGLVILDPPRAGAASQVAALSRSTVPKVLYVSCNPDTFARDAKQLVEAGYRCDAVGVVDQFVFSAETELVAAFARKS